MAININEDGDKIIMFDVLESGTGPWPSDSAEVQLQEGDTTLTGNLGDWDEEPELDLAARRMKAGTKATVEYRKADGCAIMRTVTMTKLTNVPEPFELDVDGKVAQAVALKEKANAHLKDKQYEKAERWYLAALRYSDVKFGLGAAEQDNLKACTATIENNLAVVLMAREEFRRAIDVLTDSISHLPENPKAYLRRAKCHARAHEFEKAEADLDAIKDASFQGDVESVRLQLARARTDANHHDKETWGSMFQEK
eukprot:TRINITY_DN1382_c0_g2_i1.p1 TRINITY_DN1382_c0_g2~~TRINITY_DN1382_c0_g2_i1.p1  ORF type:complete len:293 (+),score=106.13 TRINITY_DN1382_c0_g2_i1:118-879(+)